MIGDNIRALRKEKGITQEKKKFPLPMRTPPFSPRSAMLKAARKKETASCVWNSPRSLCTLWKITGKRWCSGWKSPEVPG